MPFREDLDQFLRVEDFAHACELRLAGGVVRTVHCIFDEPGVDADLGAGLRGGRRTGTGYTFETSGPQVIGKARDLAGASRGDELVVDGREFDILSSPIIDGTGTAVLRLAPKHGQGGR